MIYTKGNYIYSLVHPIAFFYKAKHNQKFGIAKGLHSRNSTHNTSHLYRATYQWVLLITNEKNKKVEKIFEREYEKRKIYCGAGTEFYDGSISLSEIKALLDEYDITYIELDINNLPQDEKDLILYENVEQFYDECGRHNIKIPKKMLETFSEILNDVHYDKNCNSVTLRDYQQKCIDIFADNLEKNEYFQGVYYLATGLGKTIIMWENCLKHLKMFPDDNILLITFRKDIYESIIKKFDKTKIISFVNKKYDQQILKDVKGKIIIMLRQTLIIETCQFPPNFINGIMYDESHDGATDGIDSFNVLLNLNATQDLKYRIGMSATPCTESLKQNDGVLKLYGKDNKLNYLFVYGILEGIKNEWLCKFTLDFMNVESNIDIKLFFDQMCRSNFDEHYKQNSSAYNEILSKIKKQIGFARYKKGIMWLNEIKNVDVMYDFLNGKLGNITILKSHSKFTDSLISDKIFDESKNNCLMLACSKFTTGYDTINLDIGFNFVLNESGSTTCQKLGRFLRLKDLYGKDDSIHFYQLCETNENANKGRLLGNIIKNIIGLDKFEEQKNVLAKIKKFIENEDIDVINLDEFDININIKELVYVDFKKELEKSLDLQVKKDLDIIRNYILEENAQRENNDDYIIDNLLDYNIFADQNNLETYDKLFDKYKNINLHWLLGIDLKRYVSWSDLQSLCKDCAIVGNDLNEKYENLRQKYKGIPKDPSIVYSNKFTGFDELFCVKKTIDYENI